MKVNLALAFFGLFSVALFAQNQPPVAHNLKCKIDYSTKIMQLEFDLFDAENDSLEVVVDLAGGAANFYDWNHFPQSGDLGWPVFSGTSKKVSIDLSTAPFSWTSPYLFARISVFDRQPFDFATLVASVDSQRLKQEMAFMIGKRHRTAGLAHWKEVKDSILNLTRNAKLFSQSQTVNYQNFIGFNQIGKHWGFRKPSSVYIIDAHYDTVAASPGADDNGSGTIGMIEALRVLSPFPCRKSVFFIGFDLEETGLTGSKTYNDTGIAASDTIEGAFNFEMIGYFDDAPNSQTVPTGFGTLFPDVYAALQADNFRGNFITNVSNEPSAALAKAFNDAAAAHVPALKVSPVSLAGNWQSPFYSDLLRSDHASFWQKNRPALMLTDGAEFRNPKYHTAADTVGAKFNFTFLSNVVRATVAATADLVGAEHGSWAFIPCKSILSTTTETLAENGFRVWPNPTDGDLFFEVEKGLAAQPFLLQLIDNQGVTVFSKMILDEKKVSLAGLPSGFFTVRAVFEKGETWVQKVVLR